MSPRPARPLLLVALWGLSSCHGAPGGARRAGRPDAAPRLCALLRAKNERALGAVPQASAWHERDCAGSGAGALGLLVHSVKAEPCESAEGKVAAEWRLALARVRPDGALERIGGAARLDKLLEENSSCHAVDDEHRVSLAAAADLDGDGAPEVVLVRSSSGEESLDSWEGSIWTVRGGEAARYPRDPGLPRVAPEPGRDGAFTPQVRDVDGDGRPDFLHQGPYAEAEHPVCGLFGSGLAVPAVFLYHARRDGRYVSDDEAARAQIRAYCGPAAPAYPPSEIPMHERKGEGLAEAAARYAVCARVYGADPAELKRRMDRACPAWTSDKDVYNSCGSEEAPEATECPEWLSEIIRIAPPVRIGGTRGK